MNKTIGVVGGIGPTALVKLVSELATRGGRVALINPTEDQIQTYGTSGAVTFLDMILADGNQYRLNSISAVFGAPDSTQLEDSDVDLILKVIDGELERPKGVVVNMPPPEIFEIKSYGYDQTVYLSKNSKKELSQQGWKNKNRYKR